MFVSSVIDLIVRHEGLALPCDRVFLGENFTIEATSTRSTSSWNSIPLDQCLRLTLLHRCQVILHRDFLGTSCFVELWLLQILRIRSNKVESSLRIGVATITTHAALVRLHIHKLEIASTVCLNRTGQVLVLGGRSEASHSQVILAHDRDALLHGNLAGLVMCGQASLHSALFWQNILVLARTTLLIIK